MSIEIQEANLTINKKNLLRNVNLTISPGKVTAVLGPNGAGKSTLIKAICKELTLNSGQILINGKHLWSLKQQALMVAVLPQASDLSFPFTAEEIVLLGRTPCDTSYKENTQIVLAALKQVDALHLKNQNFSTLSGGERQRIHMARVLAQIWEPCSHGHRFLLLDEPTSALDPEHQHIALSIAKKQAEQHDLGVLIVLHDLNLAAQYADYIAILHNGELVEKGTPQSVLTINTIEEIFHINTIVQPHPTRKCPLIIFK